MRSSHCSYSLALINAGPRILRLDEARETFVPRASLASSARFRLIIRRFPDSPLRSPLLP
ncbi:hypothetical protein [Rhodococcus tibetensis]|uniref:Uncharacterized protein n=1 Tax=Rhodococcus tibetensis TaxID=2965064 RepID=A0ABT1QB96_9NOCA|nr:hypothetical protein [Rhodococcus sp. FXJ9.536]MCQ4119539.1 hypothetical protein [Rhodococcus sp. FXJ9.536]